MSDLTGSTLETAGRGIPIVLLNRGQSSLLQSFDPKKGVKSESGARSRAGPIKATVPEQKVRRARGRHPHALLALLVCVCISTACIRAELCSAPSKDEAGNRGRKREKGLKAGRARARLARTSVRGENEYTKDEMLGGIRRRTYQRERAREKERQRREREGEREREKREAERVCVNCAETNGGEKAFKRQKNGGTRRRKEYAATKKLAGLREDRARGAVRGRGEKTRNCWKEKTGPVELTEERGERGRERAGSWREGNTAATGTAAKFRVLDTTREDNVHYVLTPALCQRNGQTGEPGVGGRDRGEHVSHMDRPLYVSATQLVTVYVTRQPWSRGRRLAMCASA